MAEKYCLLCYCENRCKCRKCIVFFSTKVGHWHSKCCWHLNLDILLFNSLLILIVYYEWCNKCSSKTQLVGKNMLRMKNVWTPRAKTTRKCQSRKHPLCCCYCCWFNALNPRFCLFLNRFIAVRSVKVRKKGMSFIFGQTQSFFRCLIVISHKSPK